MNEQTAASKKLQFSEVIKKHFNYPMLLLAIITILNLRNIISSFVRIFSYLFTAPLSGFVALFSFVLSASPAVILLFLWCYRFQKIKNVKIWTGVFLLFIVLLTAYRTYPIIVSFFSDISQYDAYTLYAGSPFIYVTEKISTLVIYAIAAIVLLLDKKVPSIYYIIIVISIAVTLFLGIITQMIISIGHNVSGGLIAAFIDVLTYIAFWYIPMALNGLPSAEITKAKNKGIIAIAALVLFIYVVSSLAVGGGNSSSNASTNTCGYCGRSYKAGDKDGNFMSIAKTGLCKNCDDNRSFFEWVLD